MPTLLERGIPIDVINDYSSSEKKQGGSPPHWEMVFWWTRKPLASARAIIAASLLPDNAYQSMEQFLNDLFPCRNEKKDKKTVHSCNPSQRLIEKLRGKRLLDPFAGFGSIPLEASRLGVDAVAVELLPTAYVFLKAVLEYPRLFRDRFIEVDGKTIKELGLEGVAKQFSGKREVSEPGRYRVPMLIYDVARWGSWVINRLREDPVIRELYDADVYIGTWEVKCPVCGRYTPLVGNWWLARVKRGNRGYKRLAWMEGQNGEIKVVDLNEQCKQQRLGNCDNLSAEVTTRGEEGGSVRWANQKFVVPTKNIDLRRETAQCLYCRAEINHRVVNGKVVKGNRKDGDWYVKWALRQWNENYEKYLRGEITLDELRQSPARPTLLVKVYVKDGDLQFKPATQQDMEKLWKAAEELRKMWGDPNIPTEMFAPYQMGTAGALRITLWGFDKFYKLFNPRQLLTLIKFVNLIRQVGHIVEEEKLKEGWNSEDARKYAEAVTTYLTIALIRFVIFNSVTSPIRPDTIMGAIIAGSMTFRGLAVVWNYGDMSPYTNITGSWLKNIKTTISSLRYVFLTIFDNNGNAKVLLDDASELSKLEGERFDVIVTDPPYADDVPYSELSDFYYVWLKRALSDVENNELKPRFLPEAFFDEFGLEIPTQWQRFAPKEVSENEGRWEHFGLKVTFAKLLTRAFANVLRFLKEDGVLIVYYVAKKPEAWAALVDALWRENRLELVAAYPVETESEESVVARGKASVLGGYVSAWRRRVGDRSLDLDVAREEAFREVASRLEARLKVLRGRKGGTTTWVYSYLAALEYLTAHYPVRLGGVELGSDGLMRQAVVLAFEALLRSSGIKLTDRGAHAYLALRIMESESGRVDSDTLSYVEKAVGLEHKDLVGLGLITEVETGGPNVAKRKTFEVLAPRSDTVDEVKRVYSLQRGKSAVLDCLRQLQLNALIKSVAKCTPEVKEEALNLARALIELSKSGLLDEDDVDVKLSRLVLGMEWWQ
jgi:putative DNA methylase